MPGSFFDTNILLHIASSDTAKAERAEALIRHGGTISVQVLNEISHVARRKHLLDWAELHVFLGLLRSLLTVVPLTTDTHELGLRLAERYRFSTYDAMILAAALLAGCDTLWSEDMQDGQIIEGRLRISNPAPP